MAMTAAPQMNGQDSVERECLTYASMSHSTREHRQNEPQEFQILMIWLDTSSQDSPSPRFTEVPAMTFRLTRTSAAQKTIIPILRHDSITHAD